MISVIVPNYNYRRFLKKRLGSIISQTYKDMEIIFLDDGSIDRSAEYAEKILKKSKITYRFIINSENSGSVFKQWNKGISQARGKYIWIAEADDACHVSFLERVRDVMEKNPSVGLVYTGSTVINNKNKIINSDFYTEHYRFISKTKWNRDYINKGLNEIQESLFIMNTIPNASSVLFRGDLIKKTGGAPINFTLSGDWQTYINILENSDIAFISDNLNYNRIHKKRVTAATDISSIYFDESLQIAGFLLERYKIPLESQRIYLFNFMRQLAFSNGHFTFSRDFYNRLKKLFPIDLVDEAIIEFINTLLKEPRLPQWLTRLKKITPKKVIKRCLRKRI